MATGITTREKLSDDALTAAMPHRDEYPLPSDKDKVTLQYENKCPECDVLRDIPTQFSLLDNKGVSSPIKEIAPNALVLADNLYGLHGLINSCQKATLIYIDPPYNTGMDFQSRQLEHSYKDTRGDATYLEFMRRRLILMREALSDDGSIYIHIGHQMLAHLKVVMDEVFGAKNCRNIISRRKCSSKNYTSNQYANLNDYILFYTKTSTYKWNKPGEKATDDWILKEYPKTDNKGRYKLVPVHAPGTRNGETGGYWRGVAPPPGKHWQYIPSKLDELDRIGEIHWSKNGNPRRKVYLPTEKAIPYTDYWPGFRDAHHQSINITGYPTEKNLSMLQMIVGASSDPRDLVLDPFCGSGTTLHAADELGRKWIGIDESFSAVKATLTRFRHGLDRMGDYVDRSEECCSDDDEGNVKVLDLFSTMNTRMPITQKQADNKRDRTSKFTFLVDEELIRCYGGEIYNLATI